MNLSDSMWTGAALDVNTITLNGNEWLLTGNSNVRDMIINAGTIYFGGNVPHMAMKEKLAYVVIGN